MRWVILSLTIAFAPFASASNDADADWKRLTALDAGPGKEAPSAADALRVSLEHLDAQEKALRAFLKEHPDDSRSFSARLRLSRLLSLRSELKEQLEPDEAERLLREAEEMAASPQQRADVDFLKLSQEMRRWQGKRPTPEGRAQVLGGVRRFQQMHPKDARIAALLLEASMLYEGDVRTKESLLREASRLATNPGQKSQIADDLRRISFLGKPLSLVFTGLDGKKHDSRQWRGKTAIVLFFAVASEPARNSFAELQEALLPFGNDVILAGISLDQKREDVVKFLAERKSTIPVGWDGKGWRGEHVVRFGVNAVPSAWLIDQRGLVRSLDVLEDPAGMIRQLR